MFLDICQVVAHASQPYAMVDLIIATQYTHLTLVFYRVVEIENMLLTQSMFFFETMTRPIIFQIFRVGYVFLRQYHQHKVYLLICIKDAFFILIFKSMGDTEVSCGTPHNTVSSSYK